MEKRGRAFQSFIMVMVVVVVSISMMVGAVFYNREDEVNGGVKILMVVEFIVVT